MGDFDFMGGTSKTAVPKQSLWDRARSDLRNLGLAFTPTGAKALAGEAAKLGSLVSPVFNPIAKRLAGQTGQEQINTALGRIGSGNIREGAAELLQAPGLNLIPGSFVAATALDPRTRLAEHPLYTALDVLPYAGKISRAVTKGGTLAGETASLLERAGKTPAAARIVEEGLGLDKLAGALGRRAEQAAVAKYPRVEPFVPSQLLEKSGLGGLRQRAVATAAGQTERGFQQAVKQWADEVTDAAKRADMTPERTAELSWRRQQGIPAERLNLTPNEAGWLRFYDEQTAKFAQAAQDEGRLYDLNGELYPKVGPEGERRLWREVVVGRAMERNALRAAERATPEAIGRYESQMAQRTNRLQTWTRRHAELSEQLASMADQRRSLTETLERLRKGTAPGVLNGELYPKRIGRLTDLIDRIDRTIPQRTKSLQRAAERIEYFSNLKPLKDPRIYRGQTAEGWAKLAQEQAATVADQAAKTPPARFKPLLKDELGRRLVAEIPDPAQIPGQVQRILQGDLDLARRILGKPTVERITSEVASTWQTLKASGVDPVFLHHVTPDRLNRIVRPSLSRISQTVEDYTRPLSMGNMESWIPDLQVGLTAMGVEHMQAQWSKVLYERLENLGVLESRAGVEAWAERTARAGAAPKGAQGLRAQMDALIKRDFVEWDPRQMFPVRQAKIGVPKEGVVYVPKPIMRSLKAAAKQIDKGPIAKGLGRARGVFVFSILSLSPQFFVDNMISGPMLTAVRQPSALLYLRKAVKAIKEGTLPYELSRGGHYGLGEVAQKAPEYKFGTDLAQAVIQENPAKWKAVAGSIPRGLQHAADLIDDMYKSAAYLSGEAKALKKGATSEAAKQAGLEIAHKILVDFDRMTPIEKLAMKNVTFFYGWAQHIVRYVFSLPFDHPWRVAIAGGIARQVEDRWPEGLPERFKNDLMIGQKRYPMTGMFPWLAVPDMMTMRGFISRMAPETQALLEYTGTDPLTYAPPVYGARDVEYDPVSGRPVGVRKSLGKLALESFVPQAGQIYQMMSNDPEWERLVATNPEAARARAIQTLAGVRWPRDFDPETEVAKAVKYARQVQRQQARRALEQQRQPAKTGGGGDFGFMG